ncbi:uncharacterized protein TNIN_126911 [Trichonephila inaurata madagascariensis]|uniref:Apoptosis regulatory protein Siva n=1 Tax=Trichonephila inaurata madagascariensis TaxID=2747483 RepID=A0A8X6XKT8_9ARAC|nr:uncharacterized protein TNIN_126911 [Trichonephila inaurata madagascariensis]
MPKRKSPFDEFPILSKMHIGVKEMNMYSVNSHENMKKVYEKTHSMLFNGSTILNGKTENVWNDSSKKSVLLMKKEKMTETNLCCLSKRNAKCAFCEKVLCSNCCRTCFSCNMEFCQLCSVLQYSTQEETAKCLSCL